MALAFPACDPAYLISTLLGRGGHGAVYGAYRVSNRRPVAIKIVSTLRITRWLMVEGSLRPLEVVMMSRLRGVPGIIQMITHYVLLDSTHIVMEKLPRVTDLFTLVADRQWLLDPLARPIFRQITDIVLSCHSQGIVHRDLKDENFLIDPLTLEVTLIDFGSAAFLQDAPFTDTIGTAIYAPPEWIRDRSYEGVSGDVWALGTMLYSMVVGDIPFQSDEDTCAGRDNLVYPNHVSPACQHLIRLCLHPNPRRRPTLQAIADHFWLAGKSISFFFSCLRPHALFVCWCGPSSLVDAVTILAPLSLTFTQVLV